MDEEDNQLIQRLIHERNLKQGAFRRFKTPVEKYLKYHNHEHNMTYYVRHVLKQQEKLIPHHKSWLYKDLTQFRLYLHHSGLAPSTANNYFIIIREVYGHFDVQLPQLKPFKIRETMQVTYDDLPTKEEIRRAINISDTQMKALIYFQSSSGKTLHECTTITVEMFLKSIGVSCKEENIIFELSKIKDDTTIIPLFHLERVKTNKFYYTCCSPEATHALIGWILKRHDLGETISLDTKLFPLNKSKYTFKYNQLNKKLGLGFVGRYGKFRSHALRKFHASNIGCGADLIDELQGRGKSQVHEAYIKDKPDKIKEEYTKYMKNILINMDDSKVDNISKEKEDIGEDNDEDVHNIPDVPVSNVNTDVLIQLTKQVGILEYRIEQLENMLKGVDE